MVSSTFVGSDFLFFSMLYGGLLLSTMLTTDIVTVLATSCSHHTGYIYAYHHSDYSLTTAIVTIPTTRIVTILANM